MLNRSASLAMTLRGLPSDSTCLLKAEPGKLDIKRHSPSILCVFQSLKVFFIILANSARPDEIQLYAAFQLGSPLFTEVPIKGFLVYKGLSTCSMFYFIEVWWTLLTFFTFLYFII